MVVMRKRIIGILIVSVIVLASVGIGLPDGFTQVVILGKMAIKFLEPLNMNNQPIINTSQICFSDGTCVNSTTGFSSSLPYDTYGLDIKTIINDSITWDVTGVAGDVKDFDISGDTITWA
jgi:hypothetical protein